MIGFGHMKWTYLHIFVCIPFKASGIGGRVGVECDVFPCEFCFEIGRCDLKKRESFQLRRR